MTRAMAMTATMAMFVSVIVTVGNDNDDDEQRLFCMLGWELGAGRMCCGLSKAAYPCKVS